MNHSAKHPVVLIILDGWGHREDTRDNAIAGADSPNWDRLWQDSPHTLISGSGRDVGLPAGQMGNSEVGHMSLGAGRIIYQSITRIDKAIDDGSFNDNPVYTEAIDAAVDRGGAVHVMGLLSPGGVHSHENHLFAALRLAAARGASQVFLHAFLDGRDTPPRSALDSVQRAEAVCRDIGCGRIASLCGRYYAMDRDQRWDRVERAYRLLTEGDGEHRFDSAVAGLEAAYERGENDEFVAPTVITDSGGSAPRIEDGDCVLFMNFRADRSRQLSYALLDPDFSGFTRRVRPELAAFVQTTQYAADIDAPVAYPPKSLANTLGDYLSTLDRTQLRIAETEKYAHVTFFFSGGRDEAFEGETRVLVPSPDVATYDLQPEMRAPEVTDRLVEAIRSGDYDLIVCNYANGDMVGHTGNYDATVAAVEALDACLGRVEEAVLAVGGQALVTADHGNCEQMQDYDSGQQHTQHTTEAVPLVYIGERDLQLTAEGGRLADIAPTVLDLMQLPVPDEMTGHSLVSHQS